MRAILQRLNDCLDPSAAFFRHNFASAKSVASTPLRPDLFRHNPAKIKPDDDHGSDRKTTRSCQTHNRYCDSLGLPSLISLLNPVKTMFAAFVLSGIQHQMIVASFQGNVVGHFRIHRQAYQRPGFDLGCLSMISCTPLRPSSRRCGEYVRHNDRFPSPSNA